MQYRSMNRGKYYSPSPDEYRLLSQDERSKPTKRRSLSRATIAATLALLIAPVIAVAARHKHTPNRSSSPPNLSLEIEQKYLQAPSLEIAQDVFHDLFTCGIDCKKRRNNKGEYLS